MATDRGTALTKGQLAEFVGTGTKALILISSRLGPELAHKWANNGEAMECAFLSALMLKESEIKLAPPAPQPPTYPANSVEFELTLDGEATDPMAMVSGGGYDPKGWQFNGQRVTGRHTRRFKLVRVGYCRNLDAVRQKLAKHGRIPEGQWREAFKAAYPKPDGNGPIGIADPSWVDPDGASNFSYVHSDGRSRFLWADDDPDGHWRWLVEVSK